MNNGFSVDMVIIVRVGFIAAAGAVLYAQRNPELRSRYLAYGARASTNQVSAAEGEKKSNEPQKLNLRSILDSFAGLQVPHSWFSSFYILSVTLSILWMLAVSANHAELSKLITRPSTPFERQFLTCILMLEQGVRRLSECIMFPSSSRSTMWIGHWLVGIWFYLFISIAVWLEGLPAIRDHEYSMLDLVPGIPSARTAIGILLFATASGVQHNCHAYLASLREEASSSASKQSKTPGLRYALPTHPAFKLVLTPHYLMECLIYLSLAIIAAPEGYLFNRTLLCALVFVITNLAVTANGTYTWYAQTFGREAVEGRYAMVPFVF